MRFDIRYRCAFTYDEFVAESQNELRVCPSTGDGQQVVHARVNVHPSARVLTTTDYWGTRVDAFGVRLPHESLEIEVEATVEVGPTLVAEGDVPLDALDDEGFRDEHRELLLPSRMAVATESVVALAAASAAGHDSVLALAQALRDVVDERVAHETGVTEVGTSVSDVLEAGLGVCQDRAHVLIALCRARDIPARYVSGYLCAGPTGADTTTHAWVEVAVPEHGWHTLDPSDGGIDDQRRVVIGRGRDYGDVPPLRGTYVGADEHTCVVSVDIAEVMPVPTPVTVA